MLIAKKTYCVLEYTNIPLVHVVACNAFFGLPKSMARLKFNAKF